MAATADGIDPVDALERITSLLDRNRAPAYKASAFVRAADAIRDISRYELETRLREGTLRQIPGIGETTAQVITEAMRGETPGYLLKLEAEPGPQPATPESAELRRTLRGDCHAHTRWSDGSATVEQMARAAMKAGHDYLVITDHSPRLTVANGLTRDRLEAQLDEIAGVNERVAPFRVLAGSEVDILEDGGLDHDADILERLDVVVASIHSRFKMDRAAMTTRLVTALMNPQMDILGHCTGRMVVGRNPRPGYDFDHEMVFAAAAHLDKAVEINSRPERLDPPRALLRLLAGMDVKVSIDTDAHATGQLDWQVFGTDRAVECGITTANVVNSWDDEGLLDWCRRHRSTTVSMPA